MREAEFCKLMISMTNLGAVSNLLGGKGHAASERNTTDSYNCATGSSLVAGDLLDDIFLNALSWLIMY